MSKYILTGILAMTVLSACSHAPSPGSQADPSGTANRAPHLPSSGSVRVPMGPQQQLADFRLQTSCAREAWAWVNEHERNEDYKPSSLEIIEMDQTHYSLIERGCYAVVDERSTAPNLSLFGDDRRLYKVDGGWHAIAEITGGTRNPTDGMYGVRSILTHGMKLCSVGVHKCSSYAEWEALTSPYLQD